MVEQSDKQAFQWQPRHSKEARVRRSLGQTHAAIAEAFEATACREVTPVAAAKAIAETFRVALD